jgi:hypothetical protein
VLDSNLLNTELSLVIYTLNEVNRPPELIPDEELVKELFDEWKASWF